MHGSCWVNEGVCRRLLLKLQPRFKAKSGAPVRCQFCQHTLGSQFGSRSLTGPYFLTLPLPTLLSHLWRRDAKIRGFINLIIIVFRRVLRLRGRIQTSTEGVGGELRTASATRLSRPAAFLWQMVRQKN